MSGNTSTLIAFNYFGSKFSYIENLYKYFPIHEHFVDVCGGSMVVTLNKPKSKIDTYNDINSDIVNFFKVLRSDPEKLIQLLHFTPTSREEFNESWNMDEYSDIERARRFYVRARQSFFGMGAQNKNKGWHLAVTSSRSNVSESVSKWINGIDKLWFIIDRLREIQIEHTDFRDIIKKIDFKKAFFYFDPPYPTDCRGSENDYKYEFTLKDHEDAANLLHSIEGMAMVSGYDSPTMQNLYGDWEMIKFPSKNNNLRHKRVQECIWINYPIPKIQQTLNF
jgi:DNA adenine methylase